MTYRYMDDRDDRPKRGEWNGDATWEAIKVCPDCGDVDCTVHSEEEASVAEKAMEQVVNLAPVLAAADAVLAAWDITQPVPKRLHAALSDLSDALARYRKLPF